MVWSKNLLETAEAAGMNIAGKEETVEAKLEVVSEAAEAGAVLEAAAEVAAVQVLSSKTLPKEPQTSRQRLQCAARSRGRVSQTVQGPVRMPGNLDLANQNQTPYQPVEEREVAVAAATAAVPPRLAPVGAPVLAPDLVPELVLVMELELVLKPGPGWLSLLGKEPS